MCVYAAHLWDPGLLLYICTLGCVPLRPDTDSSVLCHCPRLKRQEFAMRSTCILPCVSSDRTPVSALTLVPSSLTGVNGLQYWAQCQSLCSQKAWDSPLAGGSSGICIAHVRKDTIAVSASEWIRLAVTTGKSRGCWSEGKFSSLYMSLTPQLLMNIFQFILDHESATSLTYDQIRAQSVRPWPLLGPRGWMHDLVSPLL